MKNFRTPILLLFLAISLVLSGCTGGSAISSWPGLTIDQNNAYVAYGPYVYTVQLSNGTMVWRYPPDNKPGKGFYAAPVITPDGQLIVGGFDDILYSLNPKAGAQNWSFQTKDRPQTAKQPADRWVAPALIADQSIFAPSANSYLYRLDLKGNVTWSFKTENGLWAQPLSDGDHVYQASMDHHLYGVDAATGKSIWETDLGAAILGAPALSPDGILYVGTLNNELMAIDKNSGKIIWKVPTSGGIWYGPALQGDNLYFGDLAGTFYVLNRTNHQVIAQSQPGGRITATPLITKDKVIVGTEAGNLVAMDLNGKVLWNKTFNGKLYTTPVLSGDRILIAITQGDQLLLALDQNGNQVWAFAVPK